MTIVKSLLANAVFSLASSSIIFLNVTWLSAHIPLNDDLWDLMGAGLFIFSLQLIFLACNQTWANKLMKHVIRADFAWIVVTLLSAVYFNSALTSLAWLIIMSVNLIVLALAVWQGHESVFDGQ
jgi:hypothetical protein